MKQILLFLFFFIHSFTALSQDTPATIYFNDGESVVGYGHLHREKKATYYDKIAFKLSREEEADLWGSEMVERVVFHFFENPRTFVYVTTNNENTTNTLLLELIAEGEVNFYAYTYISGTSPMNHGAMRGSSVEVEKITYMVKRDDEGKFANLNSKKKIIEYFKDCPGIATKLNNHEFSITDLEDIVNYYNDYCAGYDFEEEELMEPEGLLEED